MPHCRLIAKLNQLSIITVLLSWKSTFLATRTQSVSLGKASSQSLLAIPGVPQATLSTGSLILLVYINDIGYRLESCVRLFADDLGIYRAITSKDDCLAFQQYIRLI